MRELSSKKWNLLSEHGEETPHITKELRTGLLHLLQPVHDYTLQ